MKQSKALERAEKLPQDTPKLPQDFHQIMALFPGKGTNPREASREAFAGTEAYQEVLWKEVRQTKEADKLTFAPIPNAQKYRRWLNVSRSEIKTASGRP